jgi:hypothetical protein
VSRTLANLQEQIKTAQLPLRIMIVNDRDQVVVHPLGPQVDKRWELPASMRREPSGIEHALADPIAGERYNASFSQVGTRGWVVIVARGEALRDVERIAYRSAYVLVGLAAGALAASGRWQLRRRQTAWLMGDALLSYARDRDTASRLRRRSRPTAGALVTPASRPGRSSRPRSAGPEAALRGRACPRLDPLVVRGGRGDPRATSVLLPASLDDV